MPFEIDASLSDGALRVGCVPDMPLQRLQAFLGAVYAQDPAVRVQVAHLPTADQVTRLRLGELDVAMIHGAVEDGDLEMLPLFEGEPMSVFLPVSHRLAESDGIGPRDVEAETLVLVPRAVDPGLHARLVSELREAGYAFDRVMETVGGDPRDVLFAVAEGFGVTVGPRSTLKRFADMASVVAGRPLAGEPKMPEMVVALSGEPHAGKGPGLAAVRGAARELSGVR